MKILGLPAIFYLLLISQGESYVSTTSSGLQHSRIRNTRLRCELSDPQLGLRRSILKQTVLVGCNLVFGPQPTFAAGTSIVDTAVPSSKNKKLGGLAFKIQSVGHVMVCATSL